MKTMRFFSYDSGDIGSKTYWDYNQPRAIYTESVEYARGAVLEKIHCVHLDAITMLWSVADCFSTKFGLCQKGVEGKI